MKTTLVLATANKNKVYEYDRLLKSALGDDFEVKSLKDIGYTDEIIEDGKTFEENAFIKARTVASLGYIGIADDSGLCVDALNGAPGIYSARYSGGDYDDNNSKLISELQNVQVENRTAQFVCSIACVFPDGRNFCVRGECPGTILEEITGENGFGYDPLFFYSPMGKTFAQMSDDEKNRVSHRAIATEKFLKQLKNYL